MPESRPSPELWKTVVTIGSGIGLASIPLLTAVVTRSIDGRFELYGLTLLAGGLIIVLSGLSYAFWQQSEWKRPPRLGWGMSCSSYPVNFKTDAQLPSYSQQLDIAVRRKLRYPIEFLVVCSAPILHYAGQLLATEVPPDVRHSVCFKRSIDSIVLAFPPLDKPINPPAILRLWVYSDQSIRVRRIKTLNRKYMKSSAKIPKEDPIPPRVSVQAPPSSPESSE